MSPPSAQSASGTCTGCCAWPLTPLVLAVRGSGPTDDMFAHLLLALSLTSQCRRAAQAPNFQNVTAIATTF